MPRAGLKRGAKAGIANCRRPPRDVSTAARCINRGTLKLIAEIPATGLKLITIDE